MILYPKGLSPRRFLSEYIFNPKKITCLKYIKNVFKTVFAKGYKCLTNQFKSEFSLSLQKEAPRILERGMLRGWYWFQMLTTVTGLKSMNTCGAKSTGHPHSPQKANPTTTLGQTFKFVVRMEKRFFTLTACYSSQTCWILPWKKKILTTIRTRSVI